jgi:asparagine synthase (glutamine-hydrolysing)
MCGIAGSVDWLTPAQPSVLRAMEKTLCHRGPDEGSIWLDQHCGFAHRRLRVIDLSPLASQPMSNPGGNLRIIFNGEIYNFKELRKQLETSAFSFRSQSDTEVLLRAYEAWGEEAFQRLRGMFALAIWDSRAQKLTLARDRFGKKPLFYSASETRFVFASELTALRCVPNQRLTISKEAFREYLEFGYVHAPRTILADVEQLCPGCVAIWTQKGLTVRPYANLSEVATQSGEDIAEVSEERIDELLRKAVASRLVADVPVGCFLSGGIDSTLVAAHARQSAGTSLRTFTVAFDDSRMNEAPWARAVAQHLGTDHHEVSIRPESIIAEFEEILASLSEPIGDDSYIPTYVISRETGREVTVALSGDGGDELFCGYDKYRQLFTSQRIRKLIPAAALTAAGSVIDQYGSDRLSKGLAVAGAKTPEASARWLSTLWKENELELLLQAPASSCHDFFSAAWKRYAGCSLLEQFMLVDMETYLPGDILAKVDRASMAHGLEVRSPFLDEDLVASALQVQTRARPGKPMLHTLLSRHLPLKLIQRPKQGFGMPINEWYRGPLRRVLEHYTSPGRLRARGLLNCEAVQQFVQLHLSGRRNFGRKLHALIAFEIWSDRFFGEAQSLA